MISFSQIIQKLKEVFSKMIHSNSKLIEHEIGISPLISNEMAGAIQLWEDMYKGHSPWLKKPTYNDPSEVVSLGLPQMIASEKARTALLEFKSEITTPMKEVDTPREDAGQNIVERYHTENPQDEKNSQNSEPNQQEGGVRTPMFHPQNTVKELVPKGPTERAEYLNKTYQKKVVPKLRREVEYGIALGGLVIKPYVIVNEPIETADGENVLTLKTELDKAEIEFDFVYADHFYPLAFNGSGDITEAAFIEHKVDKNITYSRLEHHKYISSTHQVIITNKAFKSTAQTTANEGVDLGQEIPLKQVPDWEGISPTVTINNADRLMFAYFKMPEANTIDMYCPLGVSGFDKAVELIKQADIQFSRLLWEYEGGELAIDIDRDALRDMVVRDETGRDVTVGRMSHLQQRLYRQVDLGSEGDTYNPYAPALRDSSYIQGLNIILTRIEDVTGLSRGTISEVTMSEARTATELRILKQRSYQTNDDIQKAIQKCLEDLVYVMNALCSLYEITPEGEYEVSFEWDDSILVDVDEELGKRMTLFQNGIVSKEELRMWYMGETERQAREALLKVQEENRLAVEDNLITQMDFKAQGLDSTLQQKPDSFNNKGGNE